MGPTGASRRGWLVAGWRAWRPLLPESFRQMPHALAADRRMRRGRLRRAQGSRPPGAARHGAPLSANLPVAVGSVAVAVTMMLVIIPSASIWAAGGGLLSRFLTGGRAHRIVSLGLAALLALTVVYVWL